jgi:hypothetical protein
MCPKGDDPFTDYTDYRTIQLTTGATSGHLGGYFKFTFNGEFVYIDANANNVDDDACETYIESLANIKQVSCTRGAIDSHYGTTYTIVIKSFPLFPYENNVYKHDGNPSISSFQCDTEKVDSGSGVTCDLTDVSVDVVPGKFLNSVILIN